MSQGDVSGCPPPISSLRLTVVDLSKSDLRSTWKVHSDLHSTCSGPCSRFRTQRRCFNQFCREVTFALPGRRKVVHLQSAHSQSSSFTVTFGRRRSRKTTCVEVVSCSRFRTQRRHSNQSCREVTCALPGRRKYTCVEEEAARVPDVVRSIATLINPVEKCLALGLEGER